LALPRGVDSFEGVTAREGRTATQNMLHPVHCGNIINRYF